jgi:hypothetical protein
MSHYTVLVVGEHPDDLLTPFDENMEVDKFETGYVSDKEKSRFIDYYKKKENNSINPFNDEWDDIDIDQDFEYLYEKYGSDWNGECWEKLNGKWIEFSTYNPDSRWDWYQLGGRWRGMLPLLEGKNGIKGSGGVFGNPPMIKNGVDSALIKDIDWEKIHLNPDDIKKHKRFWELKIEKDKPKNKEEEVLASSPCFYKEEYYINKYEDKETYAKARSSFHTYSFLDENGWQEPGRMGWFGMSSAKENEELNWELNFFDQIIKKLDPETRISIFDCHI